MVSLTVCRDWAVRWEEGPGLLEIWRQDDRCDNSITVGHLSSDTCGSGEQLTAVWDERRWRRRSVGACKVRILCVVVKNKISEQNRSSWEQTLPLFGLKSNVYTGNNRPRLSNRGHIYI